jgi:hypothetical protein
MSVQELVIKYVSVQTEDNTFVLLEQEPPDVDVNYLTKLGLIKALYGMTFNSSLSITTENCGSSDGSYETVIYAYPYPQELPYRTGISWGNMDYDFIKDTISYVEIIQSDLKTELNPKYPILQITSYQWIGDVYNQDGIVIPSPNLQLINNVITLSSSVYGSLFINYKTVQHKYAVVVYPRESVDSNKLQSFAWATWERGNTVLDLSPPDGAEEGICQGSYNGPTSFSHVPSAPDYVEGENETKEFDYCTRECTSGCDE